MRYSLLLVLLVTVVGCGVKRPITARHDPHPSEQLYIGSEHLRANTAIGTPVATRDAESNILYVMIPIRSTTNRQLYVDYKVTFFDRNGQLINDTGWFTRALSPNEPVDIRITSSTPRAADFRVYFRDAR